MPPRREPVPRAKNPWGWLGGILTLGVLMAGTVAAALALWENVDIQQLTRVPGDAQAIVLPDPTAPRAPAATSLSREVALYRSEATSAFFPEDDFYPDILNRWRELIVEAGGSVREVASIAEVEGLMGSGLLVAPAAVCLGDNEVDAFRSHTSEGGDLLLTWATGARDADCEWRGWSVIEEFTGASDVRELERRAGLFLTVPGGMPLSGGIEPGARLELQWDAQIAVETEGTRVYWSDWALNPEPAEGTIRVDGAVALRNVEGGGRVSWYGFLAQNAVDTLDETRIRRLLLNGILWTAGVPSAELHPWPEGSRSALLMTQEVEGEFRNSLPTANVALKHGVPITSFVVSRLATGYPELAAPLASAGELASQSSDNAMLAGLPVAEQQTRLRRSIQELQAWTGANPVGLRAPQERVDEELLRAWSSLGGTYVLGLNAGRTGSPEAFELEGSHVVLLPRMLKDDYNLVIQERILRPAELAAESRAGLNKFRAIGGLATLTVHSSLGGSARLVGAVDEVLASVVAEGGWWLATGGEVADWTLARHSTEVAFLSVASDRIELEVRAPTDRPLSNAWITVNLPDSPDVWSPVSGEAPQSYGLTPWGLVIPVDDLPAGDGRVIVLERDDSL